MDSKDNVMWASNSDVSDLRELMIQGVFGLEFRDDSLEYITKQIPFWEIMFIFLQWCSAYLGLQSNVHHSML